MRCLRGPVASSYPLSHVEPSLLLGRAWVRAVLSTVPVPTQVPFIASLRNVLTSSLKLWSNLSLPETLLHLPCDLLCYFWKFPKSQGLIASPLYAQGRTTHREKQQSLCVSNYNAWMEPQSSRRNPRCPENACPGAALAVSDPGSLEPRAILTLSRHSSWQHPDQSWSFLSSERLQASVLITLPWVRRGEARCRWGKSERALRCCCTAQGHAGKGPGSGARQREGRRGSLFVVVSARRRASGFRTRSDFSRLWGKGAAPGCLVPAPGGLGWATAAWSVRARVART